MVCGRFWCSRGVGVLCWCSNGAALADNKAGGAAPGIRSTGLCTMLASLGDIPGTCAVVRTETGSANDLRVSTLLVLICAGVRMLAPACCPNRAWTSGSCRLLKLWHLGLDGPMLEQLALRTGPQCEALRAQTAALEPQSPLLACLSSELVVEQDRPLRVHVEGGAAPTQDLAGPPPTGLPTPTPTVDGGGRPPLP